MKKFVLLIICLLLCSVSAEARQRRASKRSHKARIVRSDPCPRCVPLACPDVVTVKQQADVEEADRLNSAMRRAAEEDVEPAFQQQFIRWLTQHPEVSGSQALVEIVREISFRWYCRGREDGSKPR